MSKGNYKIFDNMMEGIQVIDHEFRYVYLNKAAVRHGKYPLESLLGFTMMEKYPGIENTKLFTCIQSSLACQDTFTLHNTFEFPDGSLGYFMLRIEPIEGGVLIMSIDVTEQRKTEAALKRSEEKYRLIFEGMMEAFTVQEIITDDDGKVTDLLYLEANAVTENILGRRIDEIIGKKRSEIMGPLDTEAAAILQKVIDTSQPAKMERFVKGNKRWYEVSIYQLRPGQIVTLNLDITARKEAEDKLQKLNLELEERVKERTGELRVSLEREKHLNNLKSRFVSMASHEFRTPLSAILSSASLIEQYASSHDQEKREKHVARIKKSVKNLTGILSEFLSLDKLERGLTQRNNELFCILGLIREIIEDFEDEAPHQRVRFKHQGLTQIFLDKTIVRNVLINLVSNAIKYSEKDVQIISKLEQDELSITVIDNGIGIPQENQHNIFTQFFRANNVNGIEGTGLGLNIVKRYVDILNGKIQFTSKTGHGTSFKVTFPVAYALNQ